MATSATKEDKKCNAGYNSDTMENIKMEDIVEKSDSTSEEANAEEAQVEETSDEITETETTEQDPLKTELERVQKSRYTEEEKAEFTFKKQAERLKALGRDPASILGIEDGEESYSDDDTPLTVGMLKRMEQEKASKTALQQADDIKSDVERELVKFHLQNTIKSTGNPSEDLKLARALVNAVKNTQIIQETTRKTPAKTHSNSSGVDGKQEETVSYTPEELAFMKPPFNATPADILAARKGIQLKFKK